MAESDGLITIGVLARASGLTPSALRFYDDCGLLVPARVDPLTGYRYYTAAQRERAVSIRRLRAIEVPLDAISEILSGDAERAERLLDEHVDELRRRALEAERVAKSLKQTLGACSTDDRVTLPAALLAEAFEQVRAAAARNREIPVLAGILVEASGNSMTLTATDRYRLSTRTVVTQEREGDWSLVLDTGDLPPTIAWLRRLDDITATPTDCGLLLAGAGVERYCQLIDAPFPDYRAVLSTLAPVRTRVLTPRTPLLTLLETSSPTVRFEIDQNGLTLTDSTRRHRLPATVTGADITLSFEVTTLLPAVHAALGPDLMLDLAAPDHPVVLRSATDGDLTTLAMPTRH
ncbi:DNA polymerase III sliding clamp (beta) subunit (PCNA family) [Nocardia tenerifensis]|uniref:DNA polymerase III sliding clamp (Beta) subunit (PCNA family) n=1 Tax=Nocardia tenerifensis TaxID=228006 RepID=A0A318K4U3_9NOCA|nr:MerR family transcriptional regulator [Nocardia tenerifensis]PXX63964.1 DNA polymerase III sliding clamp (beta) subunit (PCNA family) [Nocardia tenerifensis]